MSLCFLEVSCGEILGAPVVLEMSCPQIAGSFIDPHLLPTSQRQGIFYTRLDGERRSWGTSGWGLGLGIT